MNEVKSSGAGGERLNLREHAWPLYVAAQIVAVVGFIAAILLAVLKYRDQFFGRFFFAYLVNYCFFLAIALGGLFFVLLQHVTKAGWGVNVRRIAEWIASSMPVVAALSAPIVASIIWNRGSLYAWARPGGTEEYNHFKQVYLNPGFFIARLVFYFACWSVMGVWYWKQSIKQDVSGDYRLTIRMQALAAPALVLFGLTLTFAAFDLIMSVDPEWDSTIFGVFFFAGCAIDIFAVIILTVLLLQWRGFMRHSVTVEHFHDLGKYLFGFVFFWGYITFSQYMLQWYSSMPEETHWFKTRGATTALNQANGWSVVIIMLLFGHFLIPFAGLLSRHVKRAPKVLGFWAAWMLVFDWLNLLWLIMPSLDGKFHLSLIELSLFLGIGGVLLAVVLRKAAHDSLRPVHDPRLADSLAFENV